jgi:hypothetical protein
VDRRTDPPIMFLGHFGVAFGAKRAAPRVSLGTLFAACQLADLLWPTLVLLGIERFEIRPGITSVTPSISSAIPTRTASSPCWPGASSSVRSTL